jgi:hypothetical protein
VLHSLVFCGAENVQKNKKRNSIKNSKNKCYFNFINAKVVGAESLFLNFHQKLSSMSSKIATSKGSVLSMWALEPSLFLLLAQHSALTSPRLASTHPAIHHSILR